MNSVTISDGLQRFTLMSIVEIMLKAKKEMLKFIEMFWNDVKIKCHGSKGLCDYKGIVFSFEKSQE